MDDPGNGPKNDTTRFFAFGDFGQDGNADQTALANAMEDLASVKGIDFMLCLGDNFYPDGVDSVNDPQWESSFERIYDGPFLSKVPWYTILGNHDYLSNPQAEIAYSQKSSRWTMPNYFYTLKPAGSAGRVRIVALDTSPFDKSNYSASFKEKLAIDTATQKSWMDSVLALKDADWIIVSGHHPLYTGGARANLPNSVRTSLLPVFKRNNVRFYFSGHEHDLQYIKSPDVNQFVSGAGSELRPTGNMAYTKFAASVIGFMSVELTQNTMNVWVISSRKDTLYHTQITK